MVEQREKWKHLSAKERREEGGEEEKKMLHRPFESTDLKAVKKGMPLAGGEHNSNGVWASVCSTIHVSAKTGMQESSGTANVI